MTAAVSSSLPFVPTPSPGANAAAAPNPSGFAQMLKANQSESEAAPPEDSPEAEAPQRPSAPGPRAVQRQPARAPAEAAAKPSAGGGQVDAGAPVDGSDAKALDAAAELETDEAAAVDPALADWMAHLKLPPEVAPQGASGLPAEAAAEAAAIATAQAAGDTVLPAHGTEPRGRSSAPGAGGGMGLAGGHGKAGLPEDAGATLALGRESADIQAAAWQQESAGVIGEAAALPPQAPLEPPQALAGLGAAGPVTGRAAEAPPPAPVQASLPTPVDSPEFPQALGTQLSMLARDGIQQAELHLNPADMGPISVQIELNGNLAQVDFGADSAATRDIIENGLPELAAALRDAGFTLSGGGVHQQAQQGRRDEAAGRPGGRGRQADEPDTPAQVRSQARVSAGGVDLYA